MEQFKTCPNCQTQNAAQNLFCQACGTRLNSTDVQTGQSAYKPPQVFSQPPPQQQPPPGYHQASATQAYYGVIPIDKLGTRLDGWADLVEGAADKVEEVKKAFEEELRQRQLPQVNHTHNQITPGGFIGKRRMYHLVQSYTGASIAIYIGEFGSDLYAAWDLFVRPVIKWRNIAIMAGIAAFLGICPALIGQNLFEEPFFTLITWFFSTLGWLIPIGLVALVAGRVLKGGFLAYFIEEIDHFAADDVAATILSVHKTIMKAIDSVGLDVSLLRQKQQFSGGRRERLI